MPQIRARKYLINLPTSERVSIERVYAMDARINKDLMQLCGKLLIIHQLTIAFAESATAGRIAAEFALIPHAGKFLKGGIVCYDAALKQSLLGVSEDQIREFTPESEMVTSSITEGLKRLIPADIHVGCTGLTCPGGSETMEKPVGTMFLYGIRNNIQLFNERIRCDGDPEEVVLQTIEKVAELLNKYLGRSNI